MTGFVYQGTVACVRIRLISPHADMVVDAIIDTGYDGHLVVPENTANSLKLESKGLVRMVQANGSSSPAFTAIVDVEWDGAIITTEVSCYGNDVVIG